MSPRSSRADSRPLGIIDAIRKSEVLGKLFRDAAGAQRTSLAALLRGKRKGELIAALRDNASRQLESGLNQSPLKVLHQCAPGCSACCRSVAVDVTPLEALVVADYLRANFDEPQLAEIQKRLKSNSATRGAGSPGEMRKVQATCAFLSDEGRCRVYPARPLVCAGVFSLSRQACYAAAENPDSAQAQQTPIDSYSQTWTMGISGGLQRALVEAGLDGNLYELSSIVLRALEVFDAAERWLRGEDVFAGCTCTDPHSPPRARAQSAGRTKRDAA
jgi:Fe-S-cluster containining protein